MKTRPRILLIANLNSTTGTGQYSLLLYQNLAAITREVAVIEYMSLYRENLTRLFFGLKSRKLSFLVPVHSVLTGASHLVSLLRIPSGYDLYHITDGTLGLISRLRDPSVVTVHDLAPFLNLRDAHYSLTDALMRSSMKSILHSKAVICDSHYVAGQVKRVFSSSGLRPYVVPYGVDHELFTPRKKDSLRQRLDLPPNKKIILNVGSEEPRKNVPTLIRAFRKVLRDGTDAFLVRVGSRESPEVRQLISTAPLKDRVIFLKVSREELAQLYASADVSVF